MRSHLLEGTVGHRRSRPVVYALQHDVYYLALDLDELDAVDRRLRLLSRNRRNLLAFRDADHWPVPATDLRTSVLDHLRGEGRGPDGLADHAGHERAGLRLRLQPGELLPLPRRATASCASSSSRSTTPTSSAISTRSARRQRTARSAPRWTKAFYVSPFIDMEGGYTVHVDDAPGHLRIGINERQGDAPLLATSLVLRRRPLTDRMIARMLLRHPLMTHRTIALIHWHALHLWRRGIPFQRHGRVAHPDTHPEIAR